MDETVAKACFDCGAQQLASHKYTTKRGWHRTVRQKLSRSCRVSRKRAISMSKSAGVMAQREPFLEVKVEDSMPAYTRAGYSGAATVQRSWMGGPGKSKFKYLAKWFGGT